MSAPAETPPASPSHQVTTGRSLAFERGVIILVAVAALVAGGTALLVGTGVFGTFRAQRPVLDPLAVRFLQQDPLVTVLFAVVLGVLLALLGAWWLARSLRPEAKPDMTLSTESPGDVTVASAALSDAIRADAESLGGVTRARVRMAGTSQRPTLRMTLSLQEGTNVRQVWEELDHNVLSRARAALETDSVPTAIRLVLDRAPRQRVR